jgi:hypothetical protein
MNGVLNSTAVPNLSVSTQAEYQIASKVTSTFLSGQPNQRLQQMGTSFAFHVCCHFCLKWMWIDPQFLDSIACF